jgi:hypothetical protein
VIQTFGGRKFILSLLGLVTVCVLAFAHADPTAFGSIALIVGAYSGANSYIEGRHATRRAPESES